MNSTICVKVPESLAYSYILYVILGFLAAISNILIFLAYSKRTSRFKTACFTLNLAWSDFAYGVLLIFSGFWRMYLWAQGREGWKVTAAFCYARLATLALYSVQSQSWAILAVSCERLVAVQCPMWFFKRHASSTSGEQWIIATVIQAFCLISIGTKILYDLVFDDENRMDAICFTPWVGT